jgi:hypothetical protein
VKLKPKSWLWWFTFPFAHANYTTLGHTIFHPKGKPPSAKIVMHEEVHEAQIAKEGWFTFYALYLLAAPVLWNPWRTKWELEAGTSKKELRSYRYGWMLWP